jgi:hypothetical protein
MGTEYLDAPDEAPSANYKIKLPKKSYKLRCIKAEFKKSKERKQANGEITGNNPMIERTWEIVEPQSVKVKNIEKSIAEGSDVFEEVVIAGLDVMDWLSMTPKTKSVVKADSTRLGVEPPDDTGANATQYLNKEGWAILSTNVDTAIDEETKEPILLPSGETKIDYKHRLAEWLG